MTSYEQIYQQAKLQLSRLNTIWSPNGSDTFCHNTDSLLRQSVWNEANLPHAVIQLHVAHNSLVQAYARWNSDGVSSTDGERWNLILAAAQNQMETLGSLLNKRDRLYIKENFRNLF